MSDNYGKVVQVIGPTVDVEFDSDKLPEILNALDTENGGKRLVLEVAHGRAQAFLGDAEVVGQGLGEAVLGHGAREQALPESTPLIN